MDDVDKPKRTIRENVAVADVAKHLDAANQGANTIQTMVFEPAAGKLHVALGPGPATKLPLRTLDVGAWFVIGKKARE